MVKFEEQIPKKSKTRPSKSVKPIIPLARPENDELDALEYVTILLEIQLQEST